MIELNTIYNEDCLETMKRMPDGFIDLTVTSPPYDNLRTYNGYSFDFEPIARELYRITKNGGVVVWVVGDQTIKGSETGTSFKQALYFKECGFNLHDTMIYTSDKPPLTHNRYEQAFEYMFVLSKGKPTSFNPLNRLAKKPGGKSGKFMHTADGQFTTANTIKKTPTEVLKNNVWYYPTGHERNGHPAVFPLQLAKDHIITWSNENNLVYDPFMGSGTTAKACIDLSRNYIGSEISKEYCEIAENRLKQGVLL